MTLFAEYPRPLQERIMTLACQIAISAPKQRSKWSNTCMIDRNMIDELRVAFKAGGYDIDKAIKAYRDIITGKNK